MRSLLLNIDLDGIVTDFSLHIEEFLAREAPHLNWTHLDYKTFFLVDCIPEPASSKVQEYINSAGFFRSLKPMPNAVETLKKLVDDGHQVHLTTSMAWSSVTSADEKIAWVKHHLPFLHIKWLTITHQKHLIQCEVAIDDSPAKIEKYHENGIEHILSIGYPFNEEQVKRYSHAYTPYMLKEAAWPLFYDYISHVAKYPETNVG